MEIFAKNDYTIVAESWETSRAWGHKATLCNKWGNDIASCKIRYYNRTWETYTYQSAILGAITNRRNERKKYVVDSFKLEHNLTRLSEKAKQELYTQDEELVELGKLYNYFLNK